MLKLLSILAKKRFKWLICFLFALGFTGNVFGVSHFEGGEIYYQYTGGSTYRFFGVYYEQCNGIPQDTIIFHITDGNTSKTYSTHKCCTSYYNQGIAAGQCTRCPNNPTCSFPYGVKFVTYYADVDVSAFSGCNLTISWNTCCLGGAITTGGANDSFYIATTLNRCNGDHSSPQFQESPVMLVNYAKLTDLYQTVTPANKNDSIVYRFVYPTSSANSVIPYTSSYDYNHPLLYLGTSIYDKKPGGFHYDPRSGEMYFTPEKEDNTLIAIEADEYAKNKSGTWYLAGNTLRTFGSYSINYSNSKNTPQIAGVAGVKNDTLYTCAGVPLTLQFQTNDPGNKNDTMTISNVINETSGNFSYSSDLKPSATLSWTPANSDVSSAPYKVVMMASDDGVPVTNFVQSSLYIYVQDSMPDDSIIASSTGCGIYSFSSKNKMSKGQAFTWYADGKTISNTGTATYSFPFNGIHVVQLKVTNSLGCEWDFYDTLKIIILPNVKASGGKEICSGTSTALSATGGIQYTWAPSTGLSADTGSSVTASPTATTSYYVSGSDANGCKAVDTAKVAVDIISLKLNTDTTACAGLPAYIRANVKSAQFYGWVNRAGTQMSDSAALYFKPVSDTQYYLTVVDSFGCREIVAGTVHLDSTKLSTIHNVSVCYSDSVQLHASGGDNYFWYPEIGLVNGSHSADPYVRPPYNQDFPVSFIDQYGCAVRDTIEVIVSKIYPTISSSKIICQSSSVQLFATGGKSYIWSPAYNISNVNAAAPVVHPDATTTYYVTICDTFCGCRKTDSVTVRVNPFKQLSLGADQHICPGITTSIGPVQESGYGYLWSSSPAGYQSHLSRNDVTPVVTTTYFLSATDSATGCHSLDSITIAVYPGTKAQLSGPQTVCEYDTAVYLIPGYNKANTYTWHIYGGHVYVSGKNNKIIIWDSTGSDSIFLLQVAPSQCRDSVALVVASTPHPGAHISVDPKICLGSPTDFIDLGGGSAYQWAFGNGDSSRVRSPIYTYPSPGLYHIGLVSSDGQCTGSDTATVQVFPLPVRSPVISHTGFRQYSFDNSDSVGIVYNWNTGDGNSYNNSDITHTYNDTGIYKAVFEYGYPWGCTQDFDTAMHVRDTITPPPPHYNDTVYVVPNPFIDHIDVDFSHSHAETVQIIIYDAIGRVITQKTMNDQPAGKYTISFPPWQVSSGIYFLKYMAGGKTKVFKVVKV